MISLDEDNDKASSTPSLSEFNPDVIAYQREVIRYIRKEYDYSKGVLEVLLSGSVGCLREDALVETVDGAKPICDIKPQDYLLSFSHKSNQFVWQSSSGAYLKDKGYLYRVVHEHGEFVASENHLCATYHGNYLPLASLCVGQDLLSIYPCQDKINPLVHREWLLSGVLGCWQTISSFFYHCAKHIRQCDPQLLPVLDACLSYFPLQADVQEYGQFFYSNKPEHTDDSLVQELAHDRTFESLFLPSMHDFLGLLASKPLALEFLDSLPKAFAHIQQDISRCEQYPKHNEIHPKALLSFLCRICISFRSLLHRKSPASITNSSILAIEKLQEDWYWDLQVPNTNNYVANGAVHHNSAKSLLAAHIGCLHLLSYKGAHLLLGRRTLPDLKDTIFATICEHLEGTKGLQEGKHYWIKHNTAKIIFCNGSRITSRAWGDKKYKKFRSLQLSAAIIEELTENDKDESAAYTEISMRVGRLPHVPQNWILSCTNPDGPEHWVYNRFIKSKHSRRKVFYSRTDQNPFLPTSYIEGLKENLDPKMAQRMIYGKWVTIAGETIYHQYDSEHNYVDASFKPDKRLPVWLSFDFNISLGKPLSSVLMQVDEGGAVHIYNEMVIEGLRTLQNCEQLADAGLLDLPTKYYITGDAAGKNKDTRNNRSDYDIIKKFFAGYKQKSGKMIDYEMKVPTSNPPIKKRHNMVNAYCLNANNTRRLFVYKDAQKADEGLRLTKLKKGTSYIEDDGPDYQHITTAIGYAIMRIEKMKTENKQGMTQL